MGCVACHELFQCDQLMAIVRLDQPLAQRRGKAKIRQKFKARATNLQCHFLHSTFSIVSFVLVVHLLSISLSLFPTIPVGPKRQNRRTGSGVIWHILSAATSNDPQITSQPTIEENEGPFRHDLPLLAI